VKKTGAGAAETVLVASIVIVRASPTIVNHQ